MDIVVGTHEDRTYADGKVTATIPTVDKKDTGTVYRDTIERGIGYRRAAYPPAPATRKTYVSALRGK
jgi:hypothetical protein